MSDRRRHEFLSAGTRTGILSTTRKDGRPHAAPIWFVLDPDSAGGDTVVFTTGADSVKGRTLRRTGQAALTVDEGAPPFSFVAIDGHIEISEDPDELMRWATLLAARYMGADKAEEFGRRNAVPGELLVRLVPDKTVALDAIAD